MLRAPATGPVWPNARRGVSVLAITLLGFTFSGREALIVAVVVVIVVVAGWFLLMRRRA